MNGRWRVKKARHPADPTKPWLALPGSNYIRAHRFSSWAEAHRYAYLRTHRQ